MSLALGILSGYSQITTQGSIGRIHAAIRLIADQLAKLPSSPEQVISEVVSGAIGCGVHVDNLGHGQKPVEIFPTLKKIAHYSELLARLHHQADHIFEAAGWYQKACDDLSLYYGRDSPVGCLTSSGSAHGSPPIALGCHQLLFNPQNDRPQKDWAVTANSRQASGRACGGSWSAADVLEPVRENQPPSLTRWTQWVRTALFRVVRS